VKYLLDANAVIALLKGQEHFLARLRRHRPEEFAISAIVAHELYYGTYKSVRSQESLVRVEGLAFAVLAFDQEDAQAAGELRAHLSRTGTPIGPYDVLIAGQAMARGLILLTHNQKEFQRVPGLRIEDWE
jgi:tRNA(fMet)-specific endonuclease VapC